ncbi:hypothetical protein NBRC116601_18130 [Cognatishimia sp. WU-CL00825]
MRNAAKVSYPPVVKFVCDRFVLASAEEKIRIVLAGMRGEESISALCRREGIAESLYYNWLKELLKAGKRRRSDA